MLEMQFDNETFKIMKQRIEKFKEERQLKLSAYEKYSSQFLLQLEQLNCFEECLLYVLASKRIPISKSLKLTFQDLKAQFHQNNDQETKASNVFSQEKSYAAIRIGQKLQQVENAKDEDYLIKQNSTREIRRRLQYIRQCLSMNTEDTQYQEFLQTATLRAFYTVNNKKKQNNFQKLKKQQDITTFSFLGSSLDLDLLDECQILDNPKEQSKNFLKKQVDQMNDNDDQIDKKQDSALKNKIQKSVQIELPEENMDISQNNRSKNYKLTFPNTQVDQGLNQSIDYISGQSLQPNNAILQSEDFEKQLFFKRRIQPSKSHKKAKLENEVLIKKRCI